MIPEELKKLPQWVCTWKNYKNPMMAVAHIAASTTDPNTWTEYEIAKDAVDYGTYDNIGFVFNDNGIVGIDIDAGYNDDGLISDLALDVISTCKSYTEMSRSGRGFHIILYGDLPFKGRNNLKGVEIYKAARYFIMTGRTLIYEKLCENQPAINYILEKYFSYEKSNDSRSHASNNKIYSPVYTYAGKGKIPLEPTYPSIASGSRNISLTSLAGSWHNQGYSKDQILTMLSKVNSKSCRPPLQQNEVETIVNSITRYKR